MINDAAQCSRCEVTPGAEDWRVWRGGAYLVLGGRSFGLDGGPWRGGVDKVGDGVPKTHGCGQIMRYVECANMRVRRRNSAGGRGGGSWPVGCS